VEQGTVGVGLVYNNGVIFGADKNVTSKLIKPKSIEKIFRVDEHIGTISSGLVGDARRLVQLARKEAQENRMYYEEKIQVETLVIRVMVVVECIREQQMEILVAPGRIPYVGSDSIQVFLERSVVFIRCAARERLKNSLLIPTLSAFAIRYL